MLLRASLYILIFLGIAAAFLKVSSPKARKLILLIGSYILYISWVPWFAAVVLASTVINFWTGKWIRAKSSFIALPIGILFNLLLLGSFKYLPELKVSLALSSHRISLIWHCPWESRSGHFRP